MTLILVKIQIKNIFEILITLAYIALSNYINHRGILLTLQGRKSHQLKKYPITKANAILSK